MYRKARAQATPLDHRSARSILDFLLVVCVLIFRRVYRFIVVLGVEFQLLICQIINVFYQYLNFMRLFTVRCSGVSNSAQPLCAATS